MTLSDFARVVGVSRQAVAKVVANGGLGDLVVWSEGPNGKRKGEIADVEKAAMVWRSRPGQPASATEKRLNGRLASTAKAPKEVHASTPTPPARERAPQALPDDGEQGDRDPLQSLAEARLQKEAYQAKLARQEFEKEAGLLVETSKVMEIYGRQIQAAKTKIMAIGKLARSRIPHLTVDDSLLIEDLCREALEEVAAEAIQADRPAPVGDEA